MHRTIVRFPSRELLKFSQATPLGLNQPIPLGLSQPTVAPRATSSRIILWTQNNSSQFRMVSTGAKIRSFPKVFTKWDASRECLNIGEAPLADEEKSTLIELTNKLAERRPELARTLLSEMIKHGEKSSPSTATSISEASRPSTATSISEASRPSTATSISEASRALDSSTSASKITSAPSNDNINGIPNSNSDDGIPSLSYLSKLSDAKNRRGRGKTAFFAYCDEGDKRRILEIASKMINQPLETIPKESGKTAMFATLPPYIKHQSLLEWQKEHESTEYAEEMERQAEEEESFGSSGNRSTKSSSSMSMVRQLSRTSSSSRTRMPPRRELFNLALSQGVPMIGFGLADNSLMIVFGASIDSYFGVYVSTMAAAGLGNLCSNIVGLSLADTIEAFSSKIGLPQPKLSPLQRETIPARLASFGGTAVGVTIGCLLGLIPCWFINHDDHHH